MCRVDYEDSATVLLQKDRKARKEHKCDECRRVIGVRETYEEQRYLSEGTVYVHRTCDRCIIPRSWLVSNCGGYVYGDVAEEICEHVTEYPHLADDLGRFVTGFKSKWKNDDGILMPIPDQAAALDVKDRF